MKNWHAATFPFNLCRLFIQPAGCLLLNIVILTKGKAEAKNRKDSWPKAASYLDWQKENVNNFCCWVRMKLELLGITQMYYDYDYQNVTFS